MTTFGADTADLRLKRPTSSRDSRAARFAGAARLARATLISVAALFVVAIALGGAGASRAATLRAAHAGRDSVATTRHPAPDRRPLPPQGMFDSCDLGKNTAGCEHDLAQMQQAGLRVAVESVRGASWRQLSGFAAYAQSIGMGIMWAVNDPEYWAGPLAADGLSGLFDDWPAPSAACGCGELVQVLDCMIGRLAALPATYGYYAADDSTLTPAQVMGLTRYVSEIKAVDPSHRVMIGSAQAQGATFYRTGAVVAHEIYPETTQSLMPYRRNLAMWEAVAQSITRDQRNAARRGSPSAFILQAFSFGDNLADRESIGAGLGDYPVRLLYPSADVQLQLRNEVLEHAHPSLILWFKFAEANRGNRWQGVIRVVNTPYRLSRPGRPGSR